MSFGRCARAVVAILAGITTVLTLTGGPVQAAAVTITNATQFTDTSGAPVHAHGGGVLKVGAYYYWFGENRNADNTFRYVSAYRSTDLRTWEFRNHVLTQSSAAELASANIERPKVIYNAGTGQFVMWMHKETATDYAQARAAVAEVLLGHQHHRHLERVGQRRRRHGVRVADGVRPADLGHRRYVLPVSG